jgi:hypothetical protein
MIPKSGSATSAAEQENKGDGMATKSEIQAAEYRAEAIARPFAEAAKRSSTVSKTGEKQSGMRTERVTLEIAHWGEYPATRWDFAYCLRPKYALESVRVVEEEERQAPPTTKTATTENDYVPPAPVSRPAETRQTQAERVGGGWWFPKCDKPSAPPSPPPAPPRVHRGSGVFDASGDEVPWEGVVAALTAERDAAIRERDALRASSITQSLTADRFAAAVQSADTLRARVDELEAASGDSALARIAAAFGCKPDDHDDLVEAARLLVRERDEAVEKAASGNSQASLDGSKAASGGGEQPRGWLTEEERALAQSWERHYTQNAHYAQSPSHTNDIAAEMGKLAEVCRSLLARSSPPEVVLPLADLGDRLLRDGVIDALAAAGVAAKEVGK